MKWLLLLLYFPYASFAQTIHFEKDEILYKGSVSLPGVPASEVAARFEPAIAASMEGEIVGIQFPPGENTLVAEGAIALTTPFHIIRKVHFTLRLTANEAGYTYRVDSVAVTERRRGSKLKITSAKELLEGMEDTGVSGTANERLLNEIDLRLQKLLTVLASAMQEAKK